MTTDVPTFQIGERSAER